MAYGYPLMLSDPAGIALASPLTLIATFATQGARAQGAT
jgi:hypothetical protein